MSFKDNCAKVLVTHEETEVNQQCYNTIWWNRGASIEGQFDGGKLYVGPYLLDMFLEKILTKWPVKGMIGSADDATATFEITHTTG